MERIAFYAPMKPPDHPVPSGEREMARLFQRALALAGYEVELASQLRSRESEGSPERQRRLERAGAWIARRLVASYAARPEEERPIAWFTYHLYYKAMDWIGPVVAQALDIPYLAAEVSVAPKRANGPWSLSHAALLRTIGAADLIFPLTEANRECLPRSARLGGLLPFIDPAPFEAARESSAQVRNRLAAEQRLDPTVPWIAVAAMMRPGVKQQSYDVLAEALAALGNLPHQLLIAGDGPVRLEVESRFQALPSGRVRFLGSLDQGGLAALFAACDLYAWPSIGEAFGVSLMEAQASGLPVVAGRDGGVVSVVGHEESGLLVPPGEPAALAEALAYLLASPEARQQLGQGALTRVAQRHSLKGAAAELGEAIAACRQSHSRVSQACPSA